VKPALFVGRRKQAIAQKNSFVGGSSFFSNGKERYKVALFKNLKFCFTYETMSFINYIKREIAFKVVYFGPGLSGKTTCIQYIHSQSGPESRGKLVSLATETERTLVFPFRVPKAPKIKGFDIIWNLVTVPGPVFYDASRKLILKGADGILFVADSQEPRRDANLESLENMCEILEVQGQPITTIPLVLQYNKRDLETAMSVDEMNSDLNSWNVPAIPTIAHKGTGVMDALAELSRRILENNPQLSATNT
jgi:mutual gliding-motility protein MglA